MILNTKKIFSFILFSFLAPLSIYSSSNLDEKLIAQELNNFADELMSKNTTPIGFPANHNADLKEFYEWYLNSSFFDRVFFNNAASPKIKDNPYSFNTHKYENEVIDFFAPLCGFEKNDVWGIITTSGTDGNNHGIYFGTKYLFAKTNMKPILYVSNDAHYSIKRIADLQNLEFRVIPTDQMGHLIISEFEKVLDPNKPALVVITLGSTFKGAIDDQVEINNILKKKKPVAIYRHVDAALFGGYFAFLKDTASIISHKEMLFDSISISGHKFFGFDEPMGIFITSNDITRNLNPFYVDYLADNVPTISCSRSAISPLKFWWKIKKYGFDGFKSQAETIISNSKYLKDKFDEIQYPAWVNPYSNVIFFKQPDAWIMKKWCLAPSNEMLFGFKLAHVVVMQSVTKPIIDQFIADIKKTISK